MFRSRALCAYVLAIVVVLPSLAFAQQDQADLAKASQNPVADLISLPFQNNTFFGIGPDDDVANVLNIQPVIPISLGPVNLINRTIFPLIYLPDLTSGLPELPEGISGGSTFGLGDINYTGFSRRPPAGRSPGASAPRSAFRAPPTRSSAPRNGAPVRRRSRWCSPGRSWSVRSPASCGRSPATTTGRT
jgi:hypothetical protein